MILCQCRFINCHKRTALVRDVVNWEAKYVWGKGVRSSQFCCKPKIALKKLKP